MPPRDPLTAPASTSYGLQPVRGFSLRRVDTMSESMISIEGLTKDYGTTHALQGLNFEVPRGQIVGFLGPNGAGKSTTMKILAGYATPTAGTARISGVDRPVDPIATSRRLGYLPG